MRLKYKHCLPSRLAYKLILMGSSPPGTVLDISATGEENSLGGKVNAEFSTLSRLQVLQLAGNNFIGTIPPSLGNISSLLYLSLAQNHLTGNIPTELGQLSNLKFFQLSLNKLSGTVPQQLYNISSIYLFSVADNQLQGQIPPYLGLSLPNLEFISLAINKFSGPIPTSIVNSSGLGTLDMSVNALTGPIPNNLGSLQNLQDLNFGNNLLESSNDLSFLTSLTNCTMLSSLFLYRNNLTVATDQSITEQSISIGIRGTVGYIPPEYGMGQEISTDGDVYSYGKYAPSRVTCPGHGDANAIENGTPRNLKLDHVESRTTRNETEIQALFAVKARILVDPYKVFSSWNDTQHFCNWPGVACGRRHQRVTALNLSSLKLAGDLSPYIANLTFLRVFDLRNNNFRGPIPQEATRLRRLEQLILANNSFQGELPENLTRCLNLKAVDVNSNELRGKINPALGSLSMLQVLQLAFNNFIGTIPPSLGNISSLLYLSLKQNYLEGNIPSELGQLSNLKFLQLSLNNLSGPIPTSIVNSSRLVNLDMALNALSGPIPKNLGSLQNLQFLNFGWNFLDSSNGLSFLTSLTNCTNLSFLCLSQNKLIANDELVKRERGHCQPIGEEASEAFLRRATPCHQ
ncbi:hypothetical protein V6N11_027869 [Hibiscus sabdariffa]|uniref:Leucine-rich repeat-containing N-terminal plant-type domain-containing protein n=1 Tax=Hibiscus sabdariffa TaxID=183260 RepID=A0ABR2NZG0_9ROSI